MYRSCILVTSLICFTQAVNLASQRRKLFFTETGCHILNPQLPDTSPYDCSHLKVSSNQCFLNGETYNVDDWDGIGIDDFRDPTCGNICSCSTTSIGKAYFDCSVSVECPSDFEDLEADCFFDYDFECCPTQKCRDPVECVYNNVTYGENEQFHVNHLITCTCEEGFDGHLEAPYCRKTRCWADEKYYHAIVNKCALIYVDENESCPLAFACNEADPGTEDANVLTGPDCLFGNRKLSVGDVIEVSEPFNSTCKCEIPPLLTCKSNIDRNEAYRIMW